MNLKTFSNHSNRDHAFLSPSKYHWIRYDKEKFIKAYNNYKAVERGTKLHEIAEALITEKIVQKKSHETFRMYVNDAIRYRMEPEKELRYSDLLFGTVDALSFRDGLLRIHDLKTGTTPAHFDQLMIYAGLFCLVNYIDPFDIRFELRIYQNDEVLIKEPESTEVQQYIDSMLEKLDWARELMEQEEDYVY